MREVELGGVQLKRSIRPRGRELAVAVLSICVLASPFVYAGVARANGVPPCDVPGQIVKNPAFEVPEGLPTWYSIRVPSFASGGDSMIDFAVEPLTANRLWVTNGTVVLRTEDSGCHWSQVYELPANGSPSATDSRILEIEVAGSDIVYLPIQQTGATPTPHVVVTRDGGDTWASADGPVLGALVGRLRDLDASLGNGSAAAALIDVELTEPGIVSVTGQQAVVTTTDAGDTWSVSPLDETNLQASVATVGASVGGGRTMDHLVMNPTRPEEIWLYSEDGLMRFDGGLVDVGIGATSLVDIALDGRAIVAYGHGTTGSFSMDGGASWTPLKTGVPVDSMDIISSAPLQIATGSYGRVFGQALFPGQSTPMLIDYSPLDQRPVSDLQIAFPISGQAPSVYGRTSSTIEVLYEPKGEEVDRSHVLSQIVAPPELDMKNDLVPSSKQLRMHPGQSKTIPYELNLRAASTPTDVYFMIDISGSMQNTINGIRSAMQKIADELNETGIPVQFGVGSFRSYDTPPPYKRNRDIGPAGPELAQALNELRASGGGDETQLAALLQSVTGDGDSGIPPGLNMHFRPGSLRIAIEVTDEPISQGGLHPAYQTVTDALLKYGVRQVGLAIQEPPLLGENDYDQPAPGTPAEGLRIVARDSKATAPEGGVDCDGDVEIDIEAGEALVCLIDPARADDASLMADAIVNIIRAVEDIEDLAVTAGPSVDPAAESPVVESITPSAFPDRDLKKPNFGEFEVTVRCPHVTRTTLFPVDVRVSRPGTAVATADLDVTCVPFVKKEVLPLFSAFVPVAAVPPPPPRPPDPVPEPNPNPQPNPQQNPQAQAGFAAQEQQQPQVALAGQEGAVAPDTASEGVSEDYFMSDNSRSRIPPVGFIFTAGAITCLGGYVLVTRGSVSAARAHGRRRRRT